MAEHRGEQSRAGRPSPSSQGRSRYAANASATTWAETIANAITTYWSTSPIEHRFAATRSGNVVTITVPRSAQAGAGLERRHA
ncbi:MAG: hypothetical protein RML56_13995 [Burkholderiales bacterium]|nr:hypothetical protein [Burkholderiales bacterium]